MTNQDEKTKTLEARVAELEDKLAKVSITEEEMKTYQKVAAALGTAAAPQAAAAAPQAVEAEPLQQYQQYPCWWPPRRYDPQWWRQPPHIWRQLCYECGPGGPGGPGPGSFGGLGQ